MVISTPRKGAIQTAVRENVSLGSIVYSDALASYIGLRDGYLHEVIDHTQGYVTGRVSTNGMENFWSLLKRTIGGTYHSVHVDHLDRYLDEATYRFNTRKMKDGERFTDALGRVGGKRLTYAELTAKGF